jgi:uncharacterized membrane protein YidH (DUF202 family)
MTPSSTGSGVAAGAGGVANERTALAWMRTALALLGATLLATRVVAGRLGLLAAAFAVIALPVAVVVLVDAGRRYRAARAALGTTAGLPDGRLPAGVTVVSLVLAVTELGWVLSG